MNKTKIEWCDATWNPVTGCLHGCEYCYAKVIARRFGGRWDENALRHCAGNNEIHDIGEPYHKHTTGKNRSKSVHSIIAPYPFGFDPTFHRYRLGEPARLKTPSTIFVVSMGDLFGDWVPDEWITDVFEACKAAPLHNYLFLTKNPKRYDEIALTINTRKCRPNWYFGTTSTSSNQEFYSSGVTNCFLSIEPVMSRIGNIDLTNIDWVILGAETGNRKGKVIPKREWIDEIVAACDEASVPVFMKDSLVPIVGEENMRREFPWEAKQK